MDVGRASWAWVMIAAALAASVMAAVWTETSTPSMIYFAGALGGLAALRRSR